MQKTLLQFLDARYPNKSYGLSRKQAAYLKIQYPLLRGWVRMYGNDVLTEGDQEALSQLNDLTAKAERKTAKAERKLARALAKKERRAKRAKAAGVSPKFPKVEAQRKPKLPAKVAASSDEFLQTYEWRRVRMLAIKKYGARCQCCGASPDTGAVINVDHIKPRRFFPELALDLENLQVLCSPCNHGKGNWDMTDWRMNANVS